jgi:SAM-dependent methyltransferase
MAEAGIAERLRAGDLPSDEEFDQIYSEWHRWLSRSYWTPMEVALRAVELLATNASTRVLDVGSGVGKFCIVGALTSPAEFVGVEHRPQLVAAAQSAAARLGADRARFIAGDFSTLDFSGFDAYYLFNPFEEFGNGAMVRIDGTTERSRRERAFNVFSLAIKLREARRGSRILTYFGHGGKALPGCRLLRREMADGDALMLWEKE